MNSESVEIGRRAYVIRCRRGPSQDVVAGLAGISKQYVSMLEGGKRRFERRGLIEDLAAALGRAVADVSMRYAIPARTEVPTHVRTARPLTSTDLATLAPGRRVAPAILLGAIAWSVAHASQAGELYPREPRLQRAHAASCGSGVADAYRRFTSG
ncbi:MAG: helix-turn-helix domain-containing protein [Actinomycetota bacterium]|nr:helix-turn-helix domain-containing protein [Actinomycetota bacterium]